MPESPTDSGMRSLLVSALTLAREAVQLDTANNGHLALVKYNESVWLLRELLERMRATSSSPRRRRSAATREDQKREEDKLQDILDTYTIRISVLRSIYGTPDAAFL
ncbi:hypothetical protein H0H92_003999 [Tricholoma furcatifolium]|nr:hypothetical protein H0H92_003999 [Tricholoma furcatifolium]